MGALQFAREFYWRASNSASLWRKALWDADAEFRGTVIEEHLRTSGFQGVSGETAQRAAAAVGWLERAQDATPDGGVSYGYFPLSAPAGWDVSYPETTGYIMTSLVRYGQRTNRPDLIERALRMALWEAEVQMANGAVQAGKVCAPNQQSASAFNTGMVLDGWVTVLGVESENRVANAAERAADFLLGDMTDNGLFKTNGEFVSADAVKVYNVLCAWALYRFGDLTGAARYREAAIAAVKGALTFQRDNGWIASNCLSDPVRPLTHTIGYALQGILEVGVLAGRSDFVQAAERGFAPIVAHVKPNGFLAGRFDSRWCPAARWSCLTGSAQLAAVGYRLGQHYGDGRYDGVAHRLIDFLKSVQRIDQHPGVDGALAGSLPILASYMAGGYPNWATKYLLDALMLQAESNDLDLME